MDPRYVFKQDIEDCEATLAQTFRITNIDAALYDRAKVDAQGFDGMLEKHRDYMRQKLPNFTLDEEPAMLTVFRHFFLVGVLCGRTAERRR